MTSLNEWNARYMQAPVCEKLSVMERSFPSYLDSVVVTWAWCMGPSTHRRVISPNLLNETGFHSHTRSVQHLSQNQQLKPLGAGKALKNQIVTAVSSLTED